MYQTPKQLVDVKGKKNDKYRIKTTYKRKYI